MMFVCLNTLLEVFFQYYESSSIHKTKHYDNQKAIFGYVLATIGVVESNAKGLLHYHLQIYGGLSPLLLQRFSNMPEVCSKIVSVLDSQ